MTDTWADSTAAFREGVGLPGVDSMAMEDVWELELESLASEIFDDWASPSCSLPLCSPTGGSSKPWGLSIAARLRRCRPAAVLRGPLPWSRLVAVEAAEALAAAASSSPVDFGEGLCHPRSCDLVEVNSGGQVFFGLLKPEDGSSCGSEEGVVFKFCNSRHRRQSEQMAAEMAWHLGVSAPESRLLLRAHDEEWEELLKVTEQLCPALAELLSSKQSMQVMQFIPGVDLSEEHGAWSKDSMAASAEALGRLLVLDMVLGNPDRLPICSLSWRGNPHNVIWSGSARSGTDRCVPIDALVARRPPRMLMQDEDQKVAKVLELVLLDAASAQEILLEAVSCNANAVKALESDWAARQQEREAGLMEADAARSVNAARAFHEGVRSAFALAVRERGLLEMLVEVIRSWFNTFLAEMRALPGTGNKIRRSRTRTLQDLSHEADNNENVKERWFHWQQEMRERTRKLAEAAVAWAAERNLKTALSFKGFLGDTVLNPIVDAYELLVRLEHLVQRLRVMMDAGNATRPVDLSPHPLYVGPATAAACYHLMRKQGISLVLDCTMDLPEPDHKQLGKDIQWRRVALEDTEDQNLAPAFQEGLAAIEEAVSAGGRVLVHCHEGRSRSVSLCLAYLVTRRGLTLAEAMEFVKEKRPQARPNSGFWQQLVALEVATRGASSAAIVAGPRQCKPQAFVCSICGEKTGLTQAALDRHMRHKHKDRGNCPEAEQAVRS